MGDTNDGDDIEVTPNREQAEDSDHSRGFAGPQPGPAVPPGCQFNVTVGIFMNLWQKSRYFSLKWISRKIRNIVS